ncbi:5-carboxymethyl-2-hydroxymuconate isomerase [Sphingomonas histidinilytica]|uniref:2-keto-4-pentenoate hydratase/2-oxohepta-3-ene-1,7-dioic acid hydratase (Catechol pathway) n=1 Tax=Rhizorhabdus histidinilytica TaxID=439228 RepID=A0A1T5EM38_9SPHN|nr:fumarylacetoacetate hydrolase family protein [Rhizorhabdus histidinilytica]MBO9376734.1 5-carboxymethyl-2-hydroxymuconate isomerase [Rhizorhabdus histidinilytica]SKB85044.1 2-keto-4-pentenoate hydratase/2-oxohepta-3-ene-1,7-dioic acid hydratase (catechol pathway) [Rhizorhabdus histidinilytica]
MKLATLNIGGPVAAVVSERGYLPVADLLPGAPGDVATLIDGWDGFAPRLRDAVGAAADGDWRSYAREALLAPLPKPGKILAIGLNYVDHINETDFAAPVHQVWFSKQVNSVHGPYADVQLPRAAAETDYEVELVAVIGKRGRHIGEGDAPAHVFGYCVGNDVSARDWQMRTPQWVLGKSFDTHAPFGPWITTADELGDPHGLGIRCTVNGERRQAADTGRMCFSIWQQIAYLSQVMTLEPGDLIFTGTPAGVGLGMSPPTYLRPGDVVRCEVDRLGFIENRFVPEQAPNH